MKKALLMAPMGSVHRNFNETNISALQSLGYEVHLLANFSITDGAQKYNQEYAEKCRENGLIIHSISYQRHSLLKNLKLIKETKKLFQEEKFDLIHAHTETGGLVLRLSVKAARNAKLVYTPHGMSFYKGSSLKSQIVYRPIEKWICKKMDVNLAINEEEYAVLLKWKKGGTYLVHGVGLNIERMQKIKRSKDLIREEFQIPSTAIVILSIGELNENKNHITAIKAIAKLQRKDVYYIICGVGEKEGVLEKEAIKLGVKDNLILAGYRRDIPDIINAADVFLFPSKHEGLPVSLMEAMAGGLPIICSDIRGNKDLIKDEKNGYLFPPKDTQWLYEKLRALIDDKEKKECFSKAVQEHILEYSIEQVEKELKGIYQFNGM